MTESNWPPPELAREILADVGDRASDLALVLGSGLGGIADELVAPWSREAHEIPGYPASTVAGHRGRLLLGQLNGRRLWVVQGRVHLYEGHSAVYVTRYVRLLYELGVRTLVLTNAAGSVDRRVGPGGIVLGVDALSLFFRPLARPARDRVGDGAELERAVWACRPPLADPELVSLAEDTARREGIAIEKGVLVGSSGPAYETAAEVRAWRRLGGTVASMSTVPEALEARELGMRAVFFSLVTNYGTGLSNQPLTHGEVVAEANRAGARLGALLSALAPRL